MKALIMGGGIGGLSTAIALRHIGLDVLVFEQAAEIREVGAGLLLLPNGMTALRKLGVAGDVRTAAASLQAAQIRSWRGDVLSNLDVAEIAAKTGEDSVGVHRADLLKALLNALPDGVVRAGRLCTAIRQDDPIGDRSFYRWERGGWRPPDRRRRPAFDSPKALAPRG